MQQILHIQTLVVTEFVCIRISKFGAKRQVVTFKRPPNFRPIFFQKRLLISVSLCGENQFH